MFYQRLIITTHKALILLINSFYRRTFHLLRCNVSLEIVLLFVSGRNAIICIFLLCSLLVCLISLCLIFNLQEIKTIIIFIIIYKHSYDVITNLCT